MTEVVCPFNKEVPCPAACPFYKTNQNDLQAIDRVLASANIPEDKAATMRQNVLYNLSGQIRTQINNRKRQRAHAVGSPPQRLFCLLEEMVTKATAP